VRGAVLTGFVTGSAASAVLATDSVLQAFQKVDGGKVDKVTGKVLSANDFTSVLKSKLDSLSLQLQVPILGNTGQALTKNSNTSFDFSWNTIRTVPTGGTSGYYLRTDGTNYSWAALSGGFLPITGGNLTGDLDIHNDEGAAKLSITQDSAAAETDTTFEIIYSHDEKLRCTVQSCRFTMLYGSNAQTLTSADANIEFPVDTAQVAYVSATENADIRLTGHDDIINGFIYTLLVYNPGGYDIDPTRDAIPVNPRHYVNPSEGSYTLLTYYRFDGQWYFTSTYTNPLPVPSSSTDPCSIGETAFDSSYVYFCYAQNQWGRRDLETGW
jgi:hypothetical protein